MEGGVDHVEVEQANHLVGVDVPSNLIVQHAGLEWAYASPCTHGGCSTVTLHNGWRFATDAEWANHPGPAPFQNKCASSYFDSRWHHCDYGDFNNGHVTSHPSQLEPGRSTCCSETLLVRANATDTDGDGTPDDDDACPLDPSKAADAGQCGCGNAETDTDGDSIADCVDACPADPANDADSDGLCAGDDNCPVDANADQADFDGDAAGDVCDADDDNDGVDDVDDNCHFVVNSDQANNDGDAEGDLCDDDDDNDGVDDVDDNCQFVANTDQANFDGDDLGDACDPDDDNDDVEDGDDVCGNTDIPEVSVPSVELGTNRWALVDGDNTFDTTAPRGRGNSKRGYTTTDTGGCSCEQIIAAQGLGNGHTKYGCSNSAMDTWIASLP